MRIEDAFGGPGPAISFEFFPPKSDAAADELLATIGAMRDDSTKSVWNAPSG